MTDSGAIFRPVPQMVRDVAVRAPERPALACDDRVLTFSELDAQMDRVAAALQRDGLGPGSALAISAAASVEYAALFLGALRAGVAVAPLAPSSTPEALTGMAADADARLFFIDADNEAALAPIAADIAARFIRLDTDAFEDWLGEADAFEPVEIDPETPFNIIYSSGTTGAPKGIVQSHRMRFEYVMRAASVGYQEASVALLATPLYSNTTLVAFFPAIAYGGTVVMMRKFDAEGYLKLAEEWRATHTMLVPVQYRRLMEFKRFSDVDLSSFQFKTCTSAPFSAELKAEVMRRWPGVLVEFFGMTEGGGSCVLVCDLHPDKLHTVGRPAEGHDIRIIDEEGIELPPGEAGEIVGRSSIMMKGYNKRDDATDAARWTSPDGDVFIRTGDIGRFDEDGFLQILDRKKDVVISGGFNVYPSDIEAVLAELPDVADCSVVGVPSEKWGETPVAFVVARGGTAEAIKEAANAKLGKTQRLADVVLIDEIPRSHIGKVLKRELRDGYGRVG
ncbi:MAG: class I adenylate-forming enzyme family protein [Pseudomonadota bacterium]